MPLNRVEPGSFLTLHYRLGDPGGAAFVDTFGAQPATLSLGTGELAPAVEARLIGLTRVAFDFLGSRVAAECFEHVGARACVSPPGKGELAQPVGAATL